MLEAIRERYGFEVGDYLVLETQGRGPDRRKSRMISNEDFETLAARLAEGFEDGGSLARTSKTPSGRPGRSSSFRHQRPGLGSELAGTEYEHYQRVGRGAAASDLLDVVSRA